jgi:hypothetical protein
MWRFDRTVVTSVIHYQIGEIILVLTVTGKGVVSSGGKIQMHGCTVVRVLRGELSVDLAVAVVA